jgi:hypothetical protein
LLVGTGGAGRLHRGGRISEFAEWARPTARYGVAPTARLKAAAFDRHKSQGAHRRSDPAAVAGSLREAEQIKQGEGAYGFHATDNGFHHPSKRISITFRKFSFRSM